MIDAKQIRDTAVEEIKNRIIFYRTTIELWAKVTRVRKKDGGDFSSLARSFPAADVNPEGGIISVRSSIPHGYSVEYIEDKITLGPQIAGADEIEPLIADRISEYKARLASYEAALKNIDSLLDSVASALQALSAAINKDKTVSWVFSEAVNECVKWGQL